MKKIYKQAPLPFMGQKRKFLNKFREHLRECPPDATYVDLFGGSGLLSRTVKDYYPSARVIYNDFDNYEQRIANITFTNKLLAEFRFLLKNEPRDKLVRQDLKKIILDRIAEEKGFVDYITLSSSLLFSMNYVTSFEGLKKERFYNTIRHGEYDATGYLNGLNIVRMSYKELFTKYKDKSNVIFLVDPPYLSTETGTYTGYWKLADYLDVLTVLNSREYFYFTSNKSHILELCDWMATHSNFANPFANAVISSSHTTMNYASSYTDIMVFKGYSSSI